MKEKNDVTLFLKEEYNNDTLGKVRKVKRFKVKESLKKKNDDTPPKEGNIGDGDIPFVAEKVKDFLISIVVKEAEGFLNMNRYHDIAIVIQKVKEFLSCNVSQKSDYISFLKTKIGNSDISDVAEKVKDFLNENDDVVEDVKEFLEKNGNDMGIGAVTDLVKGVDDSYKDIVTESVKGMFCSYLRE